MSIYKCAQRPFYLNQDTEGYLSKSDLRMAVGSFQTHMQTKSWDALQRDYTDYSLLYECIVLFVCSFEF